MRSRHTLRLALLQLVVAAMVTGWHATAEEGDADTLPWALRDHYAVTIGEGRFLYAVEDAAWTIELDDAGTLVDNVGFAVTLEDGARLDTTSFESGTSGRGSISTPLGDAAEYSVTRSSTLGLTVMHRIVVYKSHPFLTIVVSVRNDSDKSVTITGIRPVVMSPGAIPGFGPGSLMRNRRLTTRGPYAALAQDALASSVIFVDPSYEATVALAALPHNVAVSSAQFELVEGAWRGEMVSVFDPPVRLDPGMQLRADPVWLCFGIPNPADVWALHAWVCGALWRSSTDIPPYWVTMKDNAPLTALYEIAEKGSSAGIRHVLVPNSWQTEQTSARLVEERYPRNMGQVAGALQDMGMIPGIAVDPLLATKQSKRATVSSADGRHWIDFSHPKAGERAVKEMEKIAGWGYQFFVITPSRIPDEVLRSLNLTRKQAEDFAFYAMNRAARGAPVLPAAEVTLAGDASGWLGASSDTAGLRENGSSIGPVRLDIAALEASSTELSAAMALFEGPIEVLATLDLSGRELTRILPRQRISSRPLDVVEEVPKVWAVLTRGGAGHYLCPALLMFPGVPEWPVADTPLTPEGPVRAWPAGKGKPIDLSAGKLASTDVLSTYMLAPDLARPVLVGAIGEAGLPHGHVSELSWAEGTSTLTGRYKGTRCAGDTVYVYVPDGWTTRTGKVGGKRLRRKHDGNLMSFYLPGGKDEEFVLFFQRK